MKMKYGFIIASGVLLSWMFTACKSTATDTVASQDTIEKVPPHLMIATVPPSPKFPDAKIAIATVQASLDADDSVKVDFNFSVKDYQLSIQTDDAADKGCNNATKGQHIHFIMDNKPYTALYEPKHSVRVAKNSEHYVLVFLSRSYHESIKEKKAAQLYHFKIDKKDFNKSRAASLHGCPDPIQPVKSAAPTVAQWIVRMPPKREIQVRFLSAGPLK